MKTTSPRYTGLFVSRRHLLFVPVILIALAILATVSFLPSAAASNPFGRVPARPNAAVGPAVTGQVASMFATRIGERSPFASLLPSLAESIETFAADCSTPKSAFSLGETVCAKTDGVNLSETRFVNWILLGSPATVVYGGEGITDITTNPQTFIFTPTAQGSYKVSIAIPGDISQTPAGFIVGPPASMAILTYAADCTTPKTSFSLGEGVCVKVVGEPLGSANPVRHLNWVARSGLVVHSTDITTDPQTDSFTLPANATTMIGGLVVDNRGTWRISSNATEDSSVRQEAYISVHDPAVVLADLWIEQGASVFNAEVEAGSTSILDLFVSNKGPDAAQDVVFTDTIPANTTFVSIVESSGLGFNCGTPDGGVVTCTIASLPPGALVDFTLAYQVNNGTPAGTIIANSASISSATSELDNSDNSSAGSAVVPTPPGAPTCTITCHENISVVADTTQGGNPGAIVNFGAGSSVGTCGAITATFDGLPAGQAASGSFYPVGTTVINVSSETGGGSCSFTITVVQATPPTISCPANKTVTAASGATTATVAVGTPTTNPSTGVTVVGIRSDDPVCNNSEIDPQCVPVPVTDPYPLGQTTITWVVRDSNGLSSTCVQTITVNNSDCGGDTTPPTITAPPDVSVGTGPGSLSCFVGLDDELGLPTVTDACSYTVSTTGIPANNAFPVGTTTVHYQATDGAGNVSVIVNQHVTVIDNTPPIIKAPADAAYTCLNDVPAASPSQATRGTVLDENGNPLPPGPPIDNCGIPTVTVSESSSGAGSIASPRIITRTFTALDSHGNSASDIQRITVTDGTPPTITAPANVSANTGPGATTCGTVVSNATLGTASASDNCAGVTVSRSPSGNTFPVGTTTVTWTATDWAGNTATANQTVTVTDNTAPVISCPASITIEPTCPSGAIATYSTPTATDNCAVQSITRTAGPASGSVFPVGTTTVTHRATDIYGNQSSCSFTVTVLTPQAVIQNLIASVNASSLTGTQKNGLLAKLNAALTAINGGGGNACSKLSDFVSNVGTLISHGDISAAQGNAWISSANHVRNYLGCTSLPCS